MIKILLRHFLNVLFLSPAWVQLSYPEHYLTQNTILNEQPQPVLFPYSQRPSFTPMLKESKNCVCKYVIFSRY